MLFFCSLFSRISENTFHCKYLSQDFICSFAQGAFAAEQSLLSLPVNRVVSFPSQSLLRYCCNPDPTACSSSCSPLLKASTSPFHQLSLPWMSQFPHIGSAGTSTVHAAPLSKWWAHKVTAAVSQSSHPLCTHACNFSFHTTQNLTPSLKQGKLSQVP